MTTVPRIRWSDIVTAPRPDECDPIDHPRLKAAALALPDEWLAQIMDPITEASS